PADQRWSRNPPHDRRRSADLAGGPPDESAADFVKLIRPRVVLAHENFGWNESAHSFVRKALRNRGLQVQTQEIRLASRQKVGFFPYPSQEPMAPPQAVILALAQAPSGIQAIDRGRTA